MFGIKTCQIILRSPSLVARLNIRLYHGLSAQTLTSKHVLSCSSFPCQQYIQQNNKSEFKPLYKKDSISTRCELIYNHSLMTYYTSMIFHVFAIPSVIIGVYFVHKDFEILQKLNFLDIEWGIPLNGIFCAISLLYINRIMTQYVLRIYYDPAKDSYIAVYPMWNLKLTKIEFKVKDCFPKINSSKLFALTPQGNISIKNQAFSIIDSGFKQHMHLERMFGRQEESHKDDAQLGITDLTKNKILVDSIRIRKDVDDYANKKIILMKKMIKKKKQ